MLNDLERQVREFGSQRIFHFGRPLTAHLIETAKWLDKWGLPPLWFVLALSIAFTVQKNFARKLSPWISVQKFSRSSGKMQKLSYIFFAWPIDIRFLLDRSLHRIAFRSRRWAQTSRLTIQRSQPFWKLKPQTLWMAHCTNRTRHLRQDLSGWQGSNL